MTQSLPDVQNRGDQRGISIERVGITGVSFPSRIRLKPKFGQDGSDGYIPVSSKVELYVGLPEEYKGVNMSRFMESLVAFHEETEDVISYSTLPQLLTRLQSSLVSKDAYVRFEFDYYVTKLSPVTKKAAPQGYRCAFTGIMHESEYEFILEVNVVAASLCPCSREMSLLHNLNPIDDLELNANQGDNWDAMKALVGHRVGMGAHNQRSQIRVRVCPTPQSMIWIEDLIEVVEAAASAPTYPLLKRPDEKFVTELAYKNAKFSEDILRDLQIGVQAIPGVSEWSLRVCNEESIHPFDVTCIQNSDGWKH